MKKTIIILILCFNLPCIGGLEGICQPLSDLKRDYSWNMGYQGYSQNALAAGFGLTNMNFNTLTPVITARADSGSFWRTSASICDSLGRLQFYTNGIFIYGTDGHSLAGNDTLSIGFYSRGQRFLDGYPLLQSALILPLPNNHHLYYVFHQQLNDNYATTPVIENLFYTIVDMAQNNGRGRVFSIRNNIIHNDSIAYGKVTACRHANGRDWWITCWAKDLYKYRRILFDPAGIHDYGWSNDQYRRYPDSAHGQCAFSPDGTKYANITNFLITLPSGVQTIGGHLEVYDFDRCTGYFSNQQSLVLQDTAWIRPNGLSFSPDSRYLYTSYFTYNGAVPSLTHQYDTWAANIPATQTVVGVYDNFFDPDFACCGSTTPNTHCLARNGKIYVTGGIGTKYWNVIESPNTGGVGCHLNQHSVHLPTFKRDNIENIPNYRLGRLIGSACDTLYTNTAPPIEDGRGVKAYPNPTNKLLLIEWEQVIPKNTTCTLTDNIGRVLYTEPVAEYSMLKEIDTSGFPNGIYFLILSSKEQGFFCRKTVSVQH